MNGISSTTPRSTSSAGTPRSTSSISSSNTANGSVVQPTHRVDRSAFRVKRTYHGQVKGVLCDFAGTVVDPGCQASQAALMEVFAKKNIRISPEETRVRDVSEFLHVLDKTRRKAIIRQIAQNVNSRFQQTYQRDSNEWDVEAMFRDYGPALLKAIPKYSNPIGNASATIAFLRENGVKVGFATDLSSEALASLVAELERHHIPNDATVCVDEVPAAQPQPWMCMVAAMKLGVYPMQATVRVTSSIQGIESGLNAGMWVVAVASTGWEMQFNEKESSDRSPNAQSTKIAAVADRLYAAGAHYVIDTIDQLPEVIPRINIRLERGETP